MQAIGYRNPGPLGGTGPLGGAGPLVSLDMPQPELRPRDLLVRVRAVSVNPVDTKQRMNAAPPPGTARILGFDATGIVEAVGPDVRHYRVGDAVWYAGAIDRPGSNAEFQAVDERLVGHKPASLDFADAAALPRSTSSRATSPTAVTSSHDASSLYWRAVSMVCRSVW